MKFHASSTMDISGTNGSVDSVAIVKNSSEGLDNLNPVTVPPQQFHRFIKPQVHPKLSEFCTRLTGITQQHVDRASSFPQVYKEFLDFLIHQLQIDYNDPYKTPALFFTCGDWDLKTMLPAQYALSRTLDERFMNGRPLPALFQRWINVKYVFFEFYREKCRKHGVGAARNLELPKMIDILGITWTGRLHSGIDDTKNLMRIVFQMWIDGWRPSDEQVSSK